MRWEGSWTVYGLGDKGGGFCFKDNITQKATCRVLNREVTCDRSFKITLDSSGKARGHCCLKREWLLDWGDGGGGHEKC